MKDEIGIKRRKLIRKQLAYKNTIEMGAKFVKKDIYDKAILGGIIFGGIYVAFNFLTSLSEEEEEEEDNPQQANVPITHITQFPQAIPQEVQQLPDAYQGVDPKKEEEEDSLIGLITKKSLGLAKIWLLEQAKDKLMTFLEEDPDIMENNEYTDEP